MITPTLNWNYIYPLQWQKLPKLAHYLNRPQDDKWDTMSRHISLDINCHQGFWMRLLTVWIYSNYLGFGRSSQEWGRMGGAKKEGSWDVSQHLCVPPESPEKKGSLLGFYVSTGNSREKAEPTPQGRHTRLKAVYSHLTSLKGVFYVVHFHLWPRHPENPLML